MRNQGNCRQAYRSEIVAKDGNVTIFQTYHPNPADARWSAGETRMQEFEGGRVRAFAKSLAVPLE